METSSLTPPSIRQFNEPSTAASPDYQPATNQANLHDVAMGALTVLVPLGLVISIVTYRRLRATALQRRITALEKLWQLTCHKEIQ